MKHRIKKKINIDLEVNTFHLFSRKIIGQATKDIYSIIEEKEFFHDTLRGIFLNTCWIFLSTL